MKTILIIPLIVLFVITNVQSELSNAYLTLINGSLLTYFAS